MGPYFWSPTNSGSGSQRRTGSSQTCVDVVGQPAVNLVDFTGLTGANFVTASAGLYFFLYGNSGNQKYAYWFNTGTETAPDTGAVSGIEEVDISPVGDAPAIAVALINLINAGGFPYWTAVQGGGFGGTGAVITASSNVNLTPATDFNTGAAFSQTQSGYPSGHYCTPTSDALAAFSFLIRPQTNFLGVGTISGLGPGYIPIDPFLSNAQLLFSDAAGTVPANTQGTTVENNTDPISGLSLVQSNSMNAPTLDFIQNANGLWVPTLAFNGTSDYLATAGNIGITGAAARTVFIVCKANNNTGNFPLCGFGTSGSPFNIWSLSGNWLLETDAGNITSSASDALWNVHCISYDGSNLNWQKNGLSSLSGFPTAKVLNTGVSSLFAGTRITVDFFLNGNIAAGPIVFSGTLTDAQKTTIFNYLAAPLGIVIS